jgi:hypothetical protein
VSDVSVCGAFIKIINSLEDLSVFNPKRKMGQFWHFERRIFNQGKKIKLG